MKDTILILHGWGISGEKYARLGELFKKAGYRVFSPDFPGFGKEPLPKDAMNVDDYVGFIYDFLKKKKEKKVIIIGHSFGGRIAIKFTQKFPSLVKGLILSGAPGIKHKLSFYRRFIMYTAVVFGDLFKFRPFSFIKDFIRKTLYFMIGEWDYYKAGDLRETFKKVIAKDLFPYLSKISIPTLLLWGEDDRVIPLSDGKKMQKLIPKSSLISIKDVGHKVPYERPDDFFNKANEFIEKI